MENTQNTNVNADEQNTEQNNEQTTFTKDEMLTLLQSETDKRVSQALATQQKKYEKQLNQQKSLVGLDEEQ